MVTGVELETEMVVMVKVALVLPLGTATLAGSLAAEELSLKDTTIPPVGAGLVRVTVPWEVEPPDTLVGLTETELNPTATGVTVKVAVLVTPP